MNLSPNFTLEEFTTSQVAARRGLDNTPGPQERINLARLASVMEQVRSLFDDQPIHVDSAYRSPVVNASVGGVSTSAHCKGLACDFQPPSGCDRFASAVLIAHQADIPFDQLILEYGWIHLAIAESAETPRRQTLTKRSASAPYEVGLQA